MCCWLLILVTCPAFLASKSKPSEITRHHRSSPSSCSTRLSPTLAASPGSRPPAPAPAPAPPAPPPKAPPAPAPRPEPAPEKVKEVIPAENGRTIRRDNQSAHAQEAGHQSGPGGQEVEFKAEAQGYLRGRCLGTRRSGQQRRDKQLREWRTAASGALSSSVGTLRSGTGSAVKVEDGFGSGTSGPSYASYAAEVVQRIYESAWVRPEDASYRRRHGRDQRDHRQRWHGC